MRSPQEFERIREANRRALGLAGVDPPVVRAFPVRPGMGDGSILSGILAGVGPITVTTAFPPFTYQYDPSTGNVSSVGSGVASWITTHVVRPKIAIGDVYTYDPAAASGAPDYSGLALAGTVLAGVGFLGFVGWVLWRAFGSSRRSNPARAARPLTSTRVSLGRPRGFTLRRRAA